MKEVEAARQQHEGGVVFYTICVKEHKTGKSKRAKFDLDKDMYDLLKMWMKVRDMLLPPSCPYVFPHFWGDHLTDLTAVVNTFGVKKVVSH